MEIYPPVYTAVTGCCADFGGIPSELAGYEHVCCPSSCYPCGGVGCLPGCCVTGIEETGTVCGGDDEGVAPCLLTSGAPNLRLGRFRRCSSLSNNKCIDEKEYAVSESIVNGTVAYLCLKSKYCDALSSHP